jgi:hypothetical protein
VQTYNRLICWSEVRARPPQFRVRAVRPHSLAFLLLGVGQILDLVGLCALGCSFAAYCLRSFKARLGHLGGILLARPTLGLPLSLGCFGRIDAVGSHFVGVLLRGGGTLRSSLCCGSLAVFGRVPRFRDFTLFRCARVVQVLFRLIALGFQFIARLLSLPRRRRVELSGTAQRITAPWGPQLDIVTISAKYVVAQ